MRLLLSLVIVACLGLFLDNYQAMAADESSPAKNPPASAWTIKSHETFGILDDAGEGQLSPNVWEKTSHAQAHQYVTQLPIRYAHPVYYELARRLLLSDAPAFAKSTETGSGDLLVARLDKLLAMGALKDADILYHSATMGNPETIELAVRGMIILMLRGQLPAACLDVQTLKEKFSAEPKWQDMDKLCRSYLPALADGAVNLATLPTLKEFPEIEQAKQQTKPTLSARISPRSLAFLVGLGQITPDLISEAAQKSPQWSTLLLSVLAEQSSIETQVGYGCALTELLTRGAMDLSTYRLAMEKARIQAEWLKIGAQRNGLDPCLAPALAYQIVMKHAGDPALYDKAVAESLQLLRQNVPSVQAVLAKFLTEKPATLSDDLRLAQTRLIVGWGDADQITRYADFLGDKATVAESAYLFLALPQMRAKFSQISSDAAPQKTVSDPEMVEKLATGLQPKGKPAGRGFAFDKKSDLTFSRNYGMPTYGIMQDLSQALKNNRLGKASALFLIGFGAYAPADIPMTYFIGITSGLSDMGITRLMRRISIEAIDAT